MIQQQQELMISPYAALYDIVVPKDNMLRQMNALVDFSFIYEELKNKYCLNNGRNAIDPIRMFKYLLLKAIFDLSDVDIVERSRYDLSFKYFLNMAPEDPVIDSSSLTKFRKLRLKDMNILDLLIGKTVTIAIEQGILKSTSIIVDATHTKARYNQQSPREVLQDRARKLRKARDPRRPVIVARAATSPHLATRARQEPFGMAYLGRRRAHHEPRTAVDHCRGRDQRRPGSVAR